MENLKGDEYDEFIHNTAEYFLRKYLRPGDAVYLKGARAAGLEQVAREMGVIDATYGEGGL